MDFTLPDQLLLTYFTQARKKGLNVDDYVTDIFNQVGERIKKENGAEAILKDKYGLSKYILEQSLDRYDPENICLAWTGGKDSTLILWILRELVEKKKVNMPTCMFIDEGNVFDEVTEFVHKYEKEWKLQVYQVHNTDVSSKAKKVGDEIVVKDLDKRNRQELKRMGYKKKSFMYEPESEVGNHLMKTVAMNRYLEKNVFRAVITGIRWDEQGAREDETYFSLREDEFTPKHTRIHPILHFTEADVWQAHKEYSIPYCALYEKGYRSLGAKGTTTKSDEKPAWEQDLEKTSERSGRRQDKEKVMKRLRDLGYM